MDWKVHCRGCQSVLRVPPTAAGRIARCPSCQCTFRLPDRQEELLEETVSSWIEEDVDHIQAEHEEELRRMAIAEHAADAEKVKPAAPRVARKPQARRPQTAPPDGLNHVSPTKVKASPPSPASPAGSTPGNGRAPFATSRPAADTAFNYPTEVNPTTPRPYLVVQRCAQDGIQFAFDSRWLNHDGFRLTMPVRSVFGRNHDADQDQLIAKPLAFVDRSQATARHVYDVERGHEYQISRAEGVGNLLSIMGMMDHVPSPFNRPMPYYIDPNHRGFSLTCTTTKRPDGGVTCYVVIPDGDYALEWLTRVNGVCGPEYDLLRRDIERLFTDEWHKLSDICRERLRGWCEFQTGEHFVYYVSDADFAKKDEGLAGLVFTDRRLLYRKYHRHGEAQPAPDTRLIFRPDEHLAAVGLAAPAGHAKVGSLHLDDVARCIEVAQQLGFQVDNRLD